MSSATLETFCCLTSSIEPGVLQKLQSNFVPYNIVCIISSIFGTLGALYQITPTVTNQSVMFQSSGWRQRKIINWLAGADLFASAGILFRSVFWLINGDIVKDHSLQSDEDLITCAVFAVWIRFFYTATYLWTLCYAIDVYFVSRQKTGKMFAYHFFTWSTSLVLSVSGLGTLYFPKFQCHTGPWRVLPNYLLSYIPIILVMVANPLLYVLASKHLRILLSGCLGQLTSVEHTILATLREKFFSIVLVFYVCWMPNVLNGIVLWGFWHRIPEGLLIGIWYAMACLNPLQAVLNSLVYKGWNTVLCSPCCHPQQERKREHFILEQSSTEYCLTSADDRLTYSTNGEYH